MNEKKLITVATFTVGAGLAAANSAEAQMGADICYGIDHGAGVGDNDDTIVHCGKSYDQNATTQTHVELAEKLFQHIYAEGPACFTYQGASTCFAYELTLDNVAMEYTCDYYQVVHPTLGSVGSAQTCTYNS